MNNINAQIETITSAINKLVQERNAILESEANAKAKWRRALAVQLKTGETVGFADSFIEAEAMMKAHAEKTYAEAVAQCRAKHVKIVAAEVPESDYVLTEVWVQA